MNKENVTNIEQSKRLAELIGTDTADMVYIGGNEDYLYTARNGANWYSKLDVLAWSFGALVDLVPVDQLGVWYMKALIMYEGFTFSTDSPAGGHYYKGKTKLEAVYNAVIDIYERRAGR